MGPLINTMLQETMGRVPTLILEQPNYVTKVAFPLETLPWVTLLTGLFHFALGLLLLPVFSLLAGVSPHWTLLCLPLVIVTYSICLLGLSFFGSAGGIPARSQAGHRLADHYPVIPRPGVLCT
jgi:lipopolysaccharide transport system permease protein